VSEEDNCLLISVDKELSQKTEGQSDVVDCAQSLLNESEENYCTETIIPNENVETTIDKNYEDSPAVIPHNDLRIITM